MSTRLYKWTGNLDAVLTSDEDGKLWMIECRPEQRFRLLKKSIHPSGYPCLVGEFVYNKEDGQRFFFEPNSEEYWNDIATESAD
jgi:hypothetical protein